MLEGAVLTETVFSWPGIGRYLTTALFAGDTTAIMGGTLLIGVSFVLINNLTDLLVRLTDPRCADADLSVFTPSAPLTRRLQRPDPVILLVLTALFAPWLAPHDPNWQDAAARLQGPGRDTGSAQTATAATCCRACSTAPARRWVWWRW